ncbi:MAG: hypothetical protein ABL891_13460 [Burkholderiales bacterium]
MPRLCAVALAALAGVVYVPHLANPLVFDDFNVVNSTDFLDYAFSFYPAPRWLTYATLAHTYALTAGSISAMRWGNLVLHAATVVAVFVLLREICLAVLDKELNAKDREFNALFVASLAAALFAVHPVAVYDVGYLVQRTTVMATLFMLMMLIAYLRWLVTGRTALWVWSAVWYLLSVFSKEHAVMAPAAALVLTLLMQRPSWALGRRLIPPFAAYTVIALLVISMVKGVLGSAYEPLALDMMKELQGFDDVRTAYSLSVITQMALFFKYLFLWIIPNVDWMSVDMREPFAISVSAWPYWAAALAFMLYPLLAIGMMLRGGRIGIAGWVLVFPWLMFATELSTVRVQEPFVLYRAYLWFPVFGALAALALSCLTSRLAVALALVMTCLLVPLSWNRLHTMSDPLLMWEDAAKLLVHGNEPGAGRIYYNRALALSAKGRKQEALADMNRVVKLHPKLAPVYYTRARVNFDLKRYAEAVEDLNASIALNSKRSAVYYARFITLRRLGREDEALQDLRKSCDMKDLIGCFALERHNQNASKAP